MPVQLTPDQEKSLDDTRKVFNRLTGKRLSLEQFLAQVVAEAIVSNARTAEIARPILALQMNKRVRHVH